MTTSRSPLSKIKAQADQIAKLLKSVERGDPIPAGFDPEGKIAAARATPGVTFAVVMDDKILKIDMRWAHIREFGEVALSEWIVKYMRGERTQ